MPVQNDPRSASYHGLRSDQLRASRHDRPRAQMAALLTFLLALLLVMMIAVPAPFALADNEEASLGYDRPTADEVIRIGYYPGDALFQDGFDDESRKSGYAYEYYQQLAPYASWDYEYEYLSRAEALDALRAGTIDIVAGIYKTPKLEEEFLFSAEDMGLDGQQRYFIVNKNNEELIEKLNDAQSSLLKDDPNFEAKNLQKYYANTAVVTSLSESERAYLAKMKSVKLGYLEGNMPISGCDSEGEPTGTLGAVLPQMEEFLHVPIEPISYPNRTAMDAAIVAGEVDVIFPVYYDAWSADVSGFYLTEPLVEDNVMIAYLGDNTDQVLHRVAMSDTAITIAPFMDQYDKNSEKIIYPTRTEAFKAVRDGEANSVMGSASILQLWIAEHPDYDNFNTAYLDEREGFSFAIRRDDPTLAMIMQETVSQLDDAFITNSLIRYSSAQTPFSITDVIKQYSLPLLAAGLMIIATIVIIFIFYRKRVNVFNERQQATREALETALSAADEASAAKTSFLSNMSHDIRTPLNGIIGMTAIARANIDDTSRVRDCLTKITSSGKHLLALINEILDVSKIESGRIELTEEPFELSEMLNDLMSINMPQARAKNQKVIVRVVDVEHESLIGDRVRLQQIYTNLLSNAIKYTKPGGRIEVTLTERPTNNPKIFDYEFVVKDNGIGMSKEYLPHLFEAFTRDSSKETAKQQGTGLGMAIALSTARLMNGDIKVESELGVGSTFTANVLLRSADNTEIAYEDLLDLRVLVVDDDRAVCESAQIMLQDMGMQCDYVLSGREAIDLLIESEELDGNNYNAAIVDWVMPGMDGLETLREIRERLGDGLPIIIISSYDWTEIEADARAAGASYFVSKPLFKSRLKHLFAEMTGQKDTSEEGDLNELTDEVSFAGKRALLAEDNELNVEVASAFLRMAGLEIEVAHNGKEALDMVRDAEPGYYDCVFMDVQMPIMNGYEATRAIRALDRSDTDWENLPIFAMTANAFAEDVKRAKAAGMTGHFAKPLDFNLVIQTVSEHLNKN